MFFYVHLFQLDSEPRVVNTSRLTQMGTVGTQNRPFCYEGLMMGSIILYTHTALGLFFSLGRTDLGPGNDSK